MLSQEDIKNYTEGLCCFFALALRDAFNIRINAIVETCKSDGHRNLVHAFCVTDSYEVDAKGIHPKGKMTIPSGYTLFPDEDSFFEIIENINEQDFCNMREGMYCYDLTSEDNSEAHQELVRKITNCEAFKPLKIN